MVGVAKWLRQRVVVPPFVGSNPITHPYDSVAKSGLRRQSAKLVFVSSNLTAVSNQIRQGETQ